MSFKVPPNSKHFVILVVLTPEMMPTAAFCWAGPRHGHRTRGRKALATGLPGSSLLVDFCVQNKCENYEKSFYSTFTDAQSLWRSSCSSFSIPKTCLLFNTAWLLAIISVRVCLWWASCPGFPALVQRCFYSNSLWARVNVWF